MVRARNPWCSGGKFSLHLPARLSVDSTDPSSTLASDLSLAKRLCSVCQMYQWAFCTTCHLPHRPATPHPICVMDRYLDDTTNPFPPIGISGYTLDLLSRRCHCCLW